MKRMTSKLVKHSAVLVQTLGLCSPAFAETYLYPDYGDLFTFDPKYTAISVGKGPGVVSFSSDVKFTDFGYRHFNALIAGDSRSSSPTNLEFRGFSFQDILSGGTGAVNVNLTVGSLELNQVNVDLNRVKLFFGAPDSTLSLRNSTLTSTTAGVRLVHDATGRFTINALEGDNLIYGGAGSTIYQPVTLTVGRGASLTLQNFNAGTALPFADSNLRFAGRNSQIDVDGGRLILDYTRLFAEHTIATFRNGASLEVTGSEWSGGTFSKLDFRTGSRLKLDHITEVNTDQLIIRDAFTANFEGNTKLNVQAANFFGTSEFIGPQLVPGNYQPSVLNINELFIASGSHRIVDMTAVNADNTLIFKGATLALENTKMNSHVIDLRGGRLEVGKDSNLVVYTWPYVNGNAVARLVSSDVGSELRVNAGGIVFFKPKAWLELKDASNLMTVNDGIIEIEGGLTGYGAVQGSGGLGIKTGAYLQPQDGRTIHVDNTLSLQTDSRVVVTLPANGTLPTQAAVTYGARPVTFDGKPIIEVRGTGSLSATTLDGQAIPVIAAQARGVTGTIQTNGLTPTVQAVNMPALIKYSVADTGTNGKPDVTLIMDRLPVDDIKRNPALTSRNRQGMANLVVAAAASSPTVNQALNTVTNEQLAGTSASGSGGSTAVLAAGSRGYFDQLHAEPYSSFITTNLELTANIRNQVFTRAMDTDPSGKRVWGDFGESRGHIDGSNDLGSFKYSLSNLSFGKDLGTWLGGAWGGYFTYAQARMNEHDIASQSLSGQNASGGLYAQWRQPGWETRVLMSYGYGRHSSTRTYSHDGLSENFTANFNSHTLQAGFRTSFDWIDHKGFEVRPEIGGSITRYRQEGFSEQGNPAFGLSVASQDAAAYIVHAGLNARMPRISADVPVRPVAFARIERDFASNSEHSVIAGLQSNPGTTATFYGQGRGPTTATLGIGLMSEDLGRWQVSGGLVAARHTNGSEWGAGFRVSYFW